MTKSITHIVLFIVAGLFFLATCTKKEGNKSPTPEELRAQIEARLAKMSDAEKWMFCTKNAAEKRFQLKGKVKDVKETIKPEELGIIDDEKTYTFDTEGRLTTLNFKVVNAGRLETTVDTVITIEDNRIVAVTGKSKNTQRTVTEISNTQYEYNTFGNFQTITTQTYDDEVQKSKVETTYTYLNDTLLTQKKTQRYKNDWTSIENSIDTLYSKKKIDKIIFVEYGESLQDTVHHKITQYKYDKFDNLENIEESVRTTAAIGDPVALDEYKYDTHGNWIEKKQWNYDEAMNKKLGRTTIREIGYH